MIILSLIYCTSSLLKVRLTYMTATDELTDIKGTALPLQVTLCRGKYSSSYTLNLLQWRIYIQKFPARTPQQDQILSFLHMFSPKSTHVGGWHPLQ